LYDENGINELCLLEILLPSDLPQTRDYSRGGK
jgi:hypothetical protein